MTSGEFLAVIEWLEDRYGSSKAWSRHKTLYPDFQPYTAGAMRQAAQAYYDSGEDRMPSPARLRRLTMDVQRQRTAAGEDPVIRPDCGGRHTWSRPGIGDLEWVEVCAVCGETRHARPCRDHQYGTRGCVYCGAPLDRKELADAN